MKLEVGKRYVMRDGTLSGVLVSNNSFDPDFRETYPFYDEDAHMSFMEDGTYEKGNPSSYDLVAEYITSAVEPVKPEWPKYYTTTDPDVYGYAMRTSENKYDLISKDGSTYLEGCHWGGRDDMVRTELTFEQAQALLDKPAVEQTPLIRTFASGATRNLDDNKLDYEGFLSPVVLHAFAEYMHGKRLQADGTFRKSSNWKLGITDESYMKSMFRHFMDVWMLYTGQQVLSPEDGHSLCRKEALCALLFNVQGMLHELLKNTDNRTPE